MTAALVSDPAANHSLFFSQKCEKTVATTLKSDITPINPEFMPPKKLATDSAEKELAETQDEAAPEPTMKQIAEQITALASEYAAFKKAFEDANPKEMAEHDEVNDAGTEGEEPTEGIDPNVEPVGKGKAVMGKGNKMAADEEEEKKMSRVIEATIKRLSAGLGIKLPAAGAPAATKSETPVDAAQKSFESELKRHGNHPAGHRGRRLRHREALDCSRHLPDPGHRQRRDGWHRLRHCHRRIRRRCQRHLRACQAPGVAGWRCQQRHHLGICVQASLIPTHPLNPLPTEE